MRSILHQKDASFSPSFHPISKAPSSPHSGNFALRRSLREKNRKRSSCVRIEDYTKSLIREIRESDGKFRHDNMTRHKCPQCGKFMLEVNGKHGKMLVCQDRECGYRETISAIQTPAARYATRKWSLWGKVTAAVRLLLRTQRKTLRIPGS